VKERFRVVAVEVGRQAGYRASEGQSVETPQTLDAPWFDPARLPETGTLAIEAQGVRFTRPGLVEEYSVSMDGVRQDFVVLERPAGVGELAVRLAVSGARVEPAVSGARFVLDNSGRKLAYSRLRATDATGRELTAQMEVESNPGDSKQTTGMSRILLTSAGKTSEVSGSALVVVVNDAEAAYPVRIDPTFSEANWSSFGGIPGVGGTVYVAAVDSAGNLYIGGIFTAVGNTIVNNIAEWNGSTWLALGSGLAGVSDASLLTGVFALAVSGSDLYAGGNFTTAGGNPANYIAKWDGSSWSPLDSGTAGTTPGTYGYVHARAVSGSDLYAGGSFSTAGDIAANRIAKWDGSSWTPLGSGVNEPVRALVVSGSDLYAGGAFTTAGGKVSEYLARAYLLPLPTLSVSRSSVPAGGVTVSWPSPDTDDFIFQQTGMLTLPAGWVSTSASVYDDGITKSVTLPATNRAQFFRLRRP
jgi:hypothetical protein